jgi:protein-disulfide isomerase
MASKNDRAAEARRLAQKQVAAKERRTTVIVVAVALVVIAAFAGIVYFIVNSSNVPSMAEVHKPAGSDLTGGIPVGASGIAGEEVDPDAVRVDLYVDYMCPVCKTFEGINAADLDELREDGTIVVYYHPVSILDRVSQGTAFSTRAANAAGVVADQAPEAFVTFSDAMFANQPAEGTAGLDDASIAAIAIGSGVPADVADRIQDGEFTKWVLAATDQASQDGMSGTPTIMVNRTILNQEVVPYFEPGALKAYLLEVAGAEPAPTPSAE